MLLKMIIKNDHNLKTCNKTIAAFNSPWFLFVKHMAVKKILFKACKHFKSHLFS